MINIFKKILEGKKNILALLWNILQSNNWSVGNVSLLNNSLLYAFFNLDLIQMKSINDVLSIKGYIKIKNDIRVYTSTNFVIDAILKSDPIAEKRNSKLHSKVAIEQYIELVELSFKTIKKINEDTYDKVLLNFYDLILISSNYSYNFSSIDYNGAIFLSPPKEDREANLIWFIDSLIHESSHLNLNLAFLDIDSFFKVDPFLLQYSSPFRPLSHKRGLYHVLHALFVLAELITFFDAFLDEINEDYTYYYDILGRNILYRHLLNRGVKFVDDPKLYNKNGLTLLNYIKGKKSDKKRKTYKLPKNERGEIISTFYIEKFKEINDIK